MIEHIGTFDKYLDFSETEYGDSEFRNDLKDVKFKFVDFDKSSFQNCNLTNVTFEHCNFNRCDYKEVRQWNCIYENCIFNKTNFFNSTMGTTVEYLNCRFEKSKLHGKYFSFGYNTKFNNCSFDICDIKSTWILSTTFNNCIFSSKLTNIRFSGEKESKASSKNGHLEYPATFINCNLGNSIFEELEIMDGAILINTILPDQHNERFNNDRIYYPKK
jgi:uncharacterized protein YjbI with pentapeptide repeats